MNNTIYRLTSSTQHLLLLGSTTQTTYPYLVCNTSLFEKQIKGHKIMVIHYRCSLQATRT